MLPGEVSSHPDKESTMLVRSLVFTALVLAATVGLIFAGGPSCAWG